MEELGIGPDNENEEEDNEEGMTAPKELDDEARYFLHSRHF